MLIGLFSAPKSCGTCLERLMSFFSFRFKNLKANRFFQKTIIVFNNICPLSEKRRGRLCCIVGKTSQTGQDAEMMSHFYKVHCMLWQCHVSSIVIMYILLFYKTEPRTRARPQRRRKARVKKVQPKVKRAQPRVKRAQIKAKVERNNANGHGRRGEVRPHRQQLEQQQQRMVKVEVLRQFV